MGSDQTEQEDFDKSIRRDLSLALLKRAGSPISLEAFRAYQQDKNG